MFLGFCIDLVVCYKADAIQFHEDEPDNAAEKGNEQQQQPADRELAIRNESAC